MRLTAALSTARLRMKSYAGKLEVVPSALGGISGQSGSPLGIQFMGALKDVQGVSHATLRVFPFAAGSFGPLWVAHR